MEKLKGDIERYFEEMRVRLSVVDETKREIDRLVAPDFSLFSILWVDEVRLSNMIAHLLDPNGKHGQGCQFLDAFLTMIEEASISKTASDKIRQCKQAWSGYTNVKIEIEQPTDMIEASQRRMDILAYGSGHALMIENKPWAVDQTDQLSDYGKHLEARFNGHYSMIYLNGDGTPPSKESFTNEGKAEFDKFVQDGKILLMAFRPNLTQWLKRCVVLAEADRVRWIIKDFIAYIEATFPDAKIRQAGVEMNLYQNEIIEHAKKSDQNMRVAILTGFSFQELRNSLIRDFANAMMHELKKRDWDDVDVHWWLDNPIGTFTGMTCRQSHWPQGVCVAIETQNGGVRGYIFGVKAEREKVQEDVRSDIADNLNKSFLIGKPSNWWPWYRELDTRYRNFDSEETLMALYRREAMLNDLVGDVEGIGKVLDSIFSEKA